MSMPRKNTNNFYKIIDFPLSDTKNGSLTMFQVGKSKSNKLPFKIKKVLIISGMKGKDARGGHTHHKTKQILVCVSGECVVRLDNGKNTKKIKLKKPNKALVLYPYVWHTMQDFKKNTVLLVIADTEYNEKEYIRDYDEFIKYAKKKNI